MGSGGATIEAVIEDMLVVETDDEDIVAGSDEAVASGFRWSDVAAVNDDPAARLDVLLAIECGGSTFGLHERNVDFRLIEFLWGLEIFPRERCLLPALVHKFLDD